MTCHLMLPKQLKSRFIQLYLTIICVEQCRNYIKSTSSFVLIVGMLFAHCNMLTFVTILFQGIPKCGGGAHVHMHIMFIRLDGWGS